MPKLTVVAKVVARKDAVETVKCELLKMIEPTRNEQGCIDYYLHQDNQNPAIFVFYENWENEACLLKHKNSDHYRNYVAAVDGMIDEKNVHVMEQIG